MDIKQDKTIEQDFTGFKLSLTQGSRSKKVLSNRLSIAVPDERTSVSVDFTIRQARALKSFLDKNLVD